ncbi:MAG: DUF4174 domain-containing protein, partial [Pseudomonadota bacterium]
MLPVKSTRCALAALLLGALAATNAAVVDPLSALRWESRVLLVFAESDDADDVAAMQAALQSFEPEMIERDLKVGWLLVDGDSRLDDRAIDREQANALRQRTRVDAGSFAVLLIGKDGGVKARYDQVPDLRSVFALIDGMPM